MSLPLLCPARDDLQTRASQKVKSKLAVDELWYEPKKMAWHGTHVFGAIGAIGGNDQGVSGMIPDSDGICYLIARVFGDANTQQFATKTFEAIDWAVSEKANDINMPIGMETWMMAGERSVKATYSNGALMVASAGNNGKNTLHFPAGYDGCLGVAALTADGEKADFSQFNEKVDIAAPGVSVLSIYLNGGYASATGTSHAAPAVTGAITKVWSVCRQCSNTQVEQCL